MLLLSYNLLILLATKEQPSNTFNPEKSAFHLDEIDKSDTKVAIQIGYLSKLGATEEQ